MACQFIAAGETFLSQTVRLTSCHQANASQLTRFGEQNELVDVHLHTVIVVCPAVSTVLDVRLILCGRYRRTVRLRFVASLLPERRSKVNKFMRSFFW